MALDYSSPVIHSPPATLDLPSLSAAVRSVCVRHAVARMELFGSRASEQAHDGSDYDFLVTFPPQSNAGLLEMGGLKEDLEQQLGHRVDLLSRAAVERSRNPFRRRSILAAPVTEYV
ncbi:MAG: nucleotidyltransferase domain-containing protein [Prosthecobacter sp.]|nr:nucleotidyltransferase domain-containing protein [Prosthecobacter sp.]